MAKKKKPAITLVESGLDTWKKYKESMNTLSVRMTGTPIERSDEEWKKAFEKFKKKALERGSETE
jgi:hypothetical protein